MKNNFDVCPHCGSRVPRPQNNPIISRSDGANYHLYLTSADLAPAPGTYPDAVNVQFSYALDSAAIKDGHTQVVMFGGPDRHDQVIVQIEEFANALARQLSSGNVLKLAYHFRDGRLSEA